MRLRHSIVDDELTVPKGHLFVLGDNRNDSEDSRYWGFVPESNVVGRPFVVYFSILPIESDAEPPSLKARLRAALSFHILRCKELNLRTATLYTGCAAKSRHGERLT